MTEPSLPDKVVAIDRALTRARVPHAFGGAIALAYYAEPRATVDVDVNVFVPPSRRAKVTGALAPLGVEGEIDPVVLERDGQVRLWWGRTPVDLFFAYDPVHDAMREGSRTQPFGDDTIPILGPEHLVVCKVVFDRGKDWLDISQVLVSVEGFDVDEVRRWLDRIIGSDDARRARFEDVVARVRGQD